MGLLGFLQILLNYFLHDLAWPLLALVYPLYCSVKAIEIKSLADSQKLNAYWIVLSLILLLELAVGTLLERLPFWTYIRLVIVCWLVIPHFDAAFYVYKHLLHPCFSIKPQILINCSDKQRESPLVGENKNQAEIKTNARENGSEVLENIGSKSNRTSSDVAVKDVKSAEAIKEEEITSAKQLRQAKPTHLPIENKNFVAAEIKQRVVHAAVRDFPETSASNVVHNKWTCLICKVTTETEKNKISHLKGKKHKAAYEALKANNMTSLLKAAPPPIPKKPGNVLKQKATASSQFSDKNKEEPENSTSGRSRRGRRKNKLGMEHGEDGKGTENSKPYKVPTKVKHRLKCTICNVECSGSISMQSHLRGRMHRAQLGLSKRV
ncbi:uncharacterized protein LOC133788991 [Humulus lupulus]|uniref:uncharacterized protein LOC133788991 n=1 Tax=Humulus lupulus TaxID=3486 RepID=UPI002B408EA2|nr:uncharacterized protein LOC133788991 [Humulus lupulus]